MAKKKYTWAKGYEQRTKDRQREKEQATLAKKRKEAGTMEKRRTHLKGMPSVPDRRDWDTQMEIQRLESQVDAYKKAWDAEKEINRANQEQTHRQQRTIYKLRRRVKQLLALVAVLAGIAFWATLL
jgi:hypothetical protein